MAAVIALADRYDEAAGKDEAIAAGLTGAYLLQEAARLKREFADGLRKLVQASEDVRDR